MHFIILGNRFRKQQKQLFTGHIASQQLSYRPLLFHPNIFSMQFDKDASFFIIKFIFERVMRTVNGRVPTVQTHQIGQTAFQSILRLNYSGVTILGEPAETQYAARVNVMVKTLTHIEAAANLTIRDLTYDMLAHMENKIASVEQEVEVVKSTGMKIMDATNVSFSGLASLMQSLGITDAVLSSAESPGPLIGDLVRRLAGDKVNVDSAYADLLAFQVS